MKNKSFVIIIISIILGIIVGPIVGTESSLFGITYYSLFELLGKLFLNSLMLIVVPLVVSSIITGISSMGENQGFKGVGLKTFGMFLLTNFLAIVAGMLLVNVFLTPFTEAASNIGKIKNITHVLQATDATSSIKTIILKIIPPNIFEALSTSQMLGLIFFSLLFGYVLTKIEGEPGAVLKHFWKAVYECMIKITHLIMKLLPIGVFCLVAKEFAETGFSSLKSLGFFWIVMMGSLAVHALITLPLLLKFVAKVNPLLHFKAMGSAMITAFCTSSSSATLPVTIDCLQKKAGVSSKIASLVAPLGASINLSASAMYVFIISTFLASAYGMPLSFNTQFTIFLLSLLTTLGIACVPSGCLITIILVLKAIGLPAEAVGLVVAVDRFVDMFRTMTNVFGTSSCAVIVAKLEKEKNLFSNYNTP